MRSDADASFQQPITDAAPLTTPGWLDERLGTGAFVAKYGRKVFPVHHTFFLGEMALFSFIILVVTGVYLGFMYVPSNLDVPASPGKSTQVPEAYASIQLIESIPVANLIRNVHHWAAHIMIASVMLHLLRNYFSGTYRKPREVNWLLGIVLLSLTLVAGFAGYALPYDAFSVTATGIGYAIARSIPWVGRGAAELIFGGSYPTLGSLSRLYMIHVFVVPALLATLVGLHLVVIVKQKHTQPGYARKLAEPGRVLGVPAWPYQALLAGQLFLLLFGGLFLLSAFVPAHPITAFGPPGPFTPEVKPDWYLLWIYGFLKIIPSRASFSVASLHLTVGPEFLGGVLFPALIFGLMTVAPWIDRTNRRAVRGFQYLEPPRQSPVRFAAGIGVLIFIGMLFVAAYYDTLGLTLGQMWGLALLVPVLAGGGAYILARRTAAGPGERFDPTGEDAVARIEPASDDPGLGETA